MEIDFSQELMNQHGFTLREEVPDPRGPGHPKSIETITLKIISMQALVAGERDADLREKVKRWDLNQLIRSAEDDLVELSANDVSLISKLINKTYPGPMICAQAARMLDAEPKAREAVKPKAREAVKPTKRARRKKK